MRLHNNTASTITSQVTNLKSLSKDELKLLCVRAKFIMTQKLDDPIYPTPPLGQDMRQSQFLSGV